MSAEQPNRHFVRPAALLFCCALMASACTEETPAGPGSTDAGTTVPGEDAAIVACGDTGAAILFFESTCAGCHQGTRFPDLTRAGLARLPELESRIVPGARLLVPGDPEGSFLYRKLAHTQGAAGGANMPLGRSMPVAELALVAQWIRDGGG